MTRFLYFLFALFFAGCVGSSSDKTPPSISNIQAGNLTTDSATITWETDEGADSQVEYGTALSYGSSTTPTSAKVTAHSQTLTGLQPGTLYHYRVLSRDAAGNLATSADATFTTRTAEISSPPSVPDQTAPQEPTPGAKPEPKPEMKGAPLVDKTLPSVPTALTVTASASNQIDLSWAASTDDVGVAGYRIFRNGKQIATTAATHYSDKGLAPSTGYTYSISAYDKAGNVSAQTDAAGASTLSPADTTPPQISGIAVEKLGSSEAIIRWTTNEPADGQLEYGTTPAYGTLAPRISALTTAHSQNLTELLPATGYHYRVRSRDAAGNLAASHDVTFTTEAQPDTIAPSVPRGVTAAALSYTQVNVAWNPSTDNVGVAGYKLYRNGAVVATLNAQIYSDGGLTPDTIYRYTVAAYDPSGNLSAQSVPMTVHTPPFLLGIAPRGITHAGATIQWTTPEPASAQVEYGTTTDYGALSPVDSALSTTHTIVLSGLTPSTTYHYRVVSRDAAGLSVPSADLLFTTTPPPDTLPPSAPSGLTAKAASSSQVDLTWTASSDNVKVAGYRIYRNGKQVGTTPSPTYSDKGLTPSTTYSYTISAYDAAGNLSEQSAATSVSTPRKSFFGGG